MTSTSSSSAGGMNGKRRHDVLAVISGGSGRWGSERWELWATAGHLQAVGDLGVRAPSGGGGGGGYGGWDSEQQEHCLYFL
ncbi:hypothetical protein GUJ93_ZPchr0013g35157 [Zizania palustris]|uniref:Uncharacterized protein n=1 Tax=Zizania palustris TaxID=103762 RepID=A0A8J6BZT3_ZIZPA|nr:hypothetical protein GUJ93_ZPchr0013g35157 [Zizania palustris]